MTRAGPAVAAFALFGALTAALLWPMVRDPAGTLIRNDDVYGNAWAMAWVVHQSARSPPRCSVWTCSPASRRRHWPAAASGRAWPWPRPRSCSASSCTPATCAPCSSRCPPIPASARWLASAPRGAVLELPWDEDHLHDGGRYLYWSTAHWQPMVNGWGGFFPVNATALGVTGRHFPLGPTVRELRAAGVRYVVVHMAAVRPQQQAMLTSGEPLPPGLALAADLGAERVYEIDPAGPPPKR